jgi:hypothetical protein
MTMLELWHEWNSVQSFKVRVVLAEKDLAWTEHRIELLKFDHLQPQYLSLNPRVGRGRYSLPSAAKGNGQMGPMGQKERLGSQGTNIAPFYRRRRCDRARHRR